MRKGSPSKVNWDESALRPCKQLILLASEWCQTCWKVWSLNAFMKYLKQNTGRQVAASLEKKCALVHSNVTAQNEWHLPIKCWFTRNCSTTGAKRGGCTLMLSWPGYLWRADRAVKSPTRQIKETIVVSEQKYNSALSRSPPSLFQLPDERRVSAAPTQLTQRKLMLVIGSVRCACVCFATVWHVTWFNLIFH